MTSTAVALAQTNPPAARPDRFTNGTNAITSRAQGVGGGSHTVTVQTRAATVATNQVADAGFQAFKLIIDRNIFDMNRGPDAARMVSQPKPVKVDAFALRGTFSYRKGDFACFDGSDTNYRQVLKVGNHIAGFRLAAIDFDSVKLVSSASNAPPIDLHIGMEMRREDQGPWQQAAAADAFAAADAPATGGAETAGASAQPAASGPASDVLKRLMQRREQEMSK